MLQNFRNSLNENYNFRGLKYANKNIRTRAHPKMSDTSNETGKTYELEEIKKNNSFLKRTCRYIYNSLSFYGKNRDDLYLYPEARYQSIDTIPYEPFG